MISAIIVVVCIVIAGYVVIRALIRFAKRIPPVNPPPHEETNNAAWLEFPLISTNAFAVGHLVLESSTDGSNWTLLTTTTNAGTYEVSYPETDTRLFRGKFVLP